MKYKHIEASRELRLWIGQIIVPVIATAATTMIIPEVRGAITSKIADIKKSRIEKKNKKKA